MPTHVMRRAPKAPNVDRKQIRELADAMLERLELFDAELSVLLTNDESIRRLNRQHRHKDQATDVLSFHFDPRFSPSNTESPRALGDIVISLDTAARQATARRRPLILELRWLLAHRILHLLGFDHVKPVQKKKMLAWTGRLVRSAPISIRKSRSSSSQRALERPSVGISSRKNSPGSSRCKELDSPIFPQQHRARAALRAVGPERGLPDLRGERAAKVGTR